MKNLAQVQNERNGPPSATRGGWRDKEENSDRRKENSTTGPMKRGEGGNGGQASSGGNVWERGEAAKTDKDRMHVARSVTPK